MIEQWKAAPELIRRTLAVALLVVTGLANVSCGGASNNDNDDNGGGSTSAPATTSAPSKPKPDRTVDKNTRAYINTMTACEVAVGLVLADIKGGDTDPVSLADNTTQARDICNGVRSKLATLDTDHFDDQAALGFYAIDRYKSGLNAILAYIDNPRPTKIIEARNKLQDGDQSATQARRDINKRRHVYGLKSYNG